MEQYDILSNILDGDYAAYLQEILKMSTSIFMCLSTEWGSLHHVDEAWLELELKVVGFECQSSVNVLSAWSREFCVLSAIASETGVELRLDWFESDWWNLLMNHYQSYNTLYKI